MHLKDRNKVDSVPHMEKFEVYSVPFGEVGVFLLNEEKATSIKQPVDLYMVTSPSTLESSSYCCCRCVLDLS